MLALREQLTWSPRWSSPAEGAYTRLAKLARVNRLSLATWKSHVFGVDARLIRKQPFHRNSCANGEWMANRTPAARSNWASELRDATLTPIFADRISCVAGDEYLRYCPVCIDHGFQSALCQVDAVVRCPIHHALLTTFCRQCGQPTGRYALDNSFNKPLQCSHCEMPLGRAWKEDAPPRWDFDCDIEPLTRIARQLGLIRRVRWFSREAWDAHFEHHRTADVRTATLGLLRCAEGSTVDQNIFHAATLHDLQLRIEVRPRPDELREFHDRNAVEAFAELSAHLLNGLGASRMLEALRTETLKLGWYPDRVEWVGSTDYKLLAYVLWRSRAATWDSPWPVGSLRRGALSWASEFHIERQDWIKILKLGYQAEVRFARWWCDRTIGLSRNSDEWRGLMSKYRSFFDVRVPRCWQSMAVVGCPQSSTHLESSRRQTLTFALGSDYFDLP
jgi:hypothetical protein